MSSPLVTLRQTKNPSATSNDRNIRHSTMLDVPKATADSRKTSASSTASRRPVSAISSQHYDHLVDELRCPGCTKPLCAPIRLCQSGHSLCGACCAGIACVLCKKPLSETRSLALEAIASRAAFGCTNGEHGCPIRQPLAALREHQKQCAYQMGDCFMGRVWGNCDWVGREMDWLEHCEAAHEDRIRHEDRAELRWQCTLHERKPSAFSAYYIFRVFGETFNLYQVYDAMRKRIAWTVICASKDPEIGHRFAFEVELHRADDDERVRHSQRHACHGERDEDVLTDGRCAAFEAGEVRQFLDASRVLHYRLRIIRIESRSDSPSPSSKRAAAIADELKAKAKLHATGEAQEVNSTEGSIAVIDDDRSSTETSSFEQLEQTITGDATVKETHKQSPFSREFRSPALVAIASVVNRVPKPPRHSMEASERDALLPDSDRDDEETAAATTEVLLAPPPPKTSVPRDEKSIEFAKTNVNA